MDARWPLLVALVLAAPAATAECTVDSTTGQEDGTWSDPVTIGAGNAAWIEHDITDPTLAAALQSITLTIEWENGPLGGADFGIAVGTPDGFAYWNPEAAYGLGPQSESVTLDRDELEDNGWTGDDLRIGPSINTGGGSLEGIPYTIHWDVTLDPDACGEDGELIPTDGEGGPGDDPQARGVPVQWWIGAGIALAGVAALVVFSTRAR